MNRIETLRNQALTNYPSREEALYRFHKKIEELGGVISYDTYGEAYYHMMSSLAPWISDGELIVGKPRRAMTQEELDEWRNKYRQIAIDAHTAAGVGQDSHMAIDYSLLLDVGVEGIIKKIDKYLEDCRDEEKIAFYRCCKKCLEGVIAHSENYAAQAAEMAKNCSDDVRRAELERIATVCRRVPRCKAVTFYDAVQSVNFITYCLTLNPLRVNYQQFQLGHPDRYLIDYYERDIASGALTKSEAQALLDCLAIQINRRVPNGLSSGYMVGGRDKDGKTVANELTLMLMQSVDNVALVYPAVGLCMTDDMPDEFIEKACEILSHGRSHPAFFNDEVISRGLMSYGVPESEAHDYIHSTCVEITPTAASNVWVASPYTNMAELLISALDREYPSFDELVERVKSDISAVIKKNYDEQNATRAHHAKNSMYPLLSCFVNDCLERGVDIERGGARYNWIMPSFVGMANLVDSLYALKEVVFDKKEYTIAGIKAILDANFEGHEELRLRLLNNIDKYGNDIDDIDKYFEIFTSHIIAECKKYTAHLPEGRLIPSVFCWIMHERFGTATGATPDGRLACFPLGDGSGPCQGREMKGPTASILSSTKWDHHSLIGGVAVNMKFSKSSLGENSLAIMKSLVRTYIERGGFELQINVVDKETLEKARENPEAYRDLVVRIGGYSDYFVRLSPQMQAEVILRTEHSI